jgi:hypothetical protein
VAKPKRRASQSYDLKGCNDDKILDYDGHRMEEVHKRIWSLHMWCGRCCWSDARKRYYDGKRAAYREQFHVVIERERRRFFFFFNRFFKIDVEVTTLCDSSS